MTTLQKDFNCTACGADLSVSDHLLDCRVELRDPDALNEFDKKFKAKMKNKSLTEKSEKEIIWAHKIRMVTVSMIQTLGKERCAKTLGLLPAGVDMLIKRNVWDLRTALNVAEALKIPLDMKILVKK